MDTVLDIMMQGEKENGEDKNIRTWNFLRMEYRWICIKTRQSQNLD